MPTICVDTSLQFAATGSQPWSDQSSITRQSNILSAVQRQASDDSRLVPAGYAKLRGTLDLD